VDGREFAEKNPEIAGTGGGYRRHRPLLVIKIIYKKKHIHTVENILFIFIKLIFII
jgi:hypothetical protein